MNTTNTAMPKRHTRALRWGLLVLALFAALMTTVAAGPTPSASAQSAVTVFSENFDGATMAGTATGGGTHGQAACGYERSGAGADTVWTSEPIDISQLEAVEIAAQVSSRHTADGLESTGGARDTISLRYALDGSETLVQEGAGNITPSTYTASGLTGSTLQVLVHMDVTADNEFYCLEAVSVTGTVATTPCALERDFTIDTSGFAFVPDESDPTYTTGTADSSGLVSTVGGVDNAWILEMDSAWRAKCFSDSSQTVQLSLTAQLSQTSRYEPDERSFLQVSVNGEITELASRAGVAPKAGPQETPMRTYSWPVELNAGTNTIDLECDNAKKTYRDEITTCTFQQMSLSTSLPAATPVPPTATAVPPTATPVPPTATPVPPTATPVLPTSVPTATDDCSFTADFANNPDFSFVADASDPAYTVAGESQDGATIQVGGRDGQWVLDMVGAWQRTCQSSVAASAEINLSASLTQAAAYDPDEQSSLHVSVNGETTELASFSGKRPRQGDQTTGLTNFDIPVQLQPGPNTISFECRNSKKTWQQEQSLCVFASVSMATASDPVPPIPPTATATPVPPTATPVPPTATATPTTTPTPTATPTTTVPSYDDPGVITVDPLTRQAFNGVSELDRSKFFNMHDRHTDRWRLSEDLIRYYRDDLQAGHGRQFWSPFSSARSEINGSSYPSTAYAQQEGAKSVDAHYRNPLRNLADARQIVVTEHPSAVMTDGHDINEGARWAADYFTHYFDNNSRPRFYEPMNEPFIHAGDYTSRYGSQEGVRAAMTEWFRAIGQEFDSRAALSDVNVIGYASAWPSMERFNFGHWNGRMKKFIDNAGPYVDAFSVHLYDGVNVTGAESQRSGSNSQAILDLIETYSMRTLGEVKPHAITEYGNIVDPAAGDTAYSESANSQSIKSFNYILMELLQREDRILTSIPFITGYSTWHWQDPARGNGDPYNPSMWRPNKNNIRLNSATNRWEFIDNNASDNYLLNKSALFFEFWKDIAGERAQVHVNDPDVQAVAFVDGAQTHIVLSNLEDGPKSIQLDIAEMAGYNFSSVKVDRLNVPKNSGAFITTDFVNANGPVDGSSQDFGTITLQENEFVRFTINFDGAVSPQRSADRTTHYSSDYLQSISGGRSINFGFVGLDTSPADAQRSTASLRMSIGRDHDRSKRPVVTVNGTTVDVPNDWPGYDQAGRVSFFGAITIPIDIDLLTPNTEVEVTFPDSGGHVSSMILDVNRVN